MKPISQETLDLINELFSLRESPKKPGKDFISSVRQKIGEHDSVAKKIVDGLKPIGFSVGKTPSRESVLSNKELWHLRAISRVDVRMKNSSPTWGATSDEAVSEAIEVIRAASGVEPEIDRSSDKFIAVTVRDFVKDFEGLSLTVAIVLNEMDKTDALRIVSGLLKDSPVEVKSPGRKEHARIKLKGKSKADSKSVIKILEDSIGGPVSGPHQKNDYSGTFVYYSIPIRSQSAPKGFDPLSHGYARSPEFPLIIVDATGGANRTETGKKGQAMALSGIVGLLTGQGAKIIKEKTNAAGEKTTDVEVVYEVGGEKHTLRVEVKSSTSDGSGVSFFDLTHASAGNVESRQGDVESKKSAYEEDILFLKGELRRAKTPAARARIEKKIEKLESRIKKNGPKGQLDRYLAANKLVADIVDPKKFPDDPDLKFRPELGLSNPYFISQGVEFSCNSSGSGRIPKSVSSVIDTGKFIATLQKHWKDHGDDIFALATGGETALYSTKPGPWTIPGTDIVLPPITQESFVDGSIQFSTYGGFRGSKSCPRGTRSERIRVALRASINVGEHPGLRVKHSPPARREDAGGGPEPLGESLYLLRELLSI